MSTSFDKDAAFDPKLPARITGIVFWGLVLVGLMLAMLMMHGAEKELARQHRDGAYLLSYHIKSQLEQASNEDSLVSGNSSLEQFLVDNQEDIGFSGLILSAQGTELRIGLLDEQDEITNHKVSVVQSSGADLDMDLVVGFPNRDEVISNMRKNMLLSVGIGVFLFGLLLQQVLQRVLTRPFLTMVDTARRFTSGDKNARFDESSSDEFGYLGRFINNALDTLIDHQKDLQVALKRATATEHELSYQASHDTLTGLFNRRKFEEHLHHVLMHVVDERRNHTLCYLDLDHFKIVNDTCGHVAGDELLKQLPALFNKVLRSGDVIARLGGDEFGVLLENCNTEQSLVIADKIRKEIETFRFTWQGQTFQIGVSIGVVSINDDNNQISEVMSAADVACYAAKDSGRNRIHVYEPSDELVNERHGQMHWTSRITSALQHDDFELFLQRISPLHDDEGMDHYEVLVRMVVDGEMVEPGAFIPAAERYKLMGSLDSWVILETFRRIASGVLNPDTVFSINLSGETLSEEWLYQFILDASDHHGVDLSRICFEITETTAISKISSARTLIDELSAKGCRFALDDFGSGLSSFGYLKSLPVDYLKIDGVFIRDICNDAIDREMVSSICQIAKTMNLQVIAEHVEDADTERLLSEIGVDMVQGYHIGLPVQFPVKEHRKTG